MMTFRIYLGVVHHIALLQPLSRRAHRGLQIAHIMVGRRVMMKIDRFYLQLLKQSYSCWQPTFFCVRIVFVDIPEKVR
jgi:hypothetical protein